MSWLMVRVAIIFIAKLKINSVNDAEILMWIRIQ